MFDIGFPELLLVAVIGLLVLGPERLPEALRTLGLWLGRMRRSFTTVKAEIEKEIGMDEIRRQLHNEAVMEEMKRIEDEVRGLDAAASGTDKPADADATRSDSDTASADEEPSAPVSEEPPAESADNAAPEPAANPVTDTASNQPRS